MFIPGALPGENDIIDAAKGNGGRGYGYAKMKEAWTEAIAWHAKSARMKRPAALPVVISCVWREKDRRRNPDNIIAAKKFICDGLVLARILPNDGWSEIAGFFDVWEVSDRPGVLVVLKERGA